ncbi:MAG: polyketide cyclase [Acidimicrobiales bacterium]|nr:polyketide cyclase [Acidimicrobiales bacterium]
MTTLVQRDLEFADGAPWIFDFDGLVHATPAEVWAAFVDNESWTIWFERCRSCKATSAVFDGVGSTRSIAVNGLRVDERFIAWEPERLWAFTATAMRMSMFTSLVERATFDEPEPGRIRIAYRMAAQPKWWAKPLRGVIAGQATKSFAKSFAALDVHLADRRKA